jgi:hypothetical protein
MQQETLPLTNYTKTGSLQSPKASSSRMNNIALVTGNGLTLDFRVAKGISLDPSDPFGWSFRVPDDTGQPWQDAFPILANAISGNSGAHSFDVFESLLRMAKTAAPSDAARLDAEARQFIVFAYSVLQELFDRATLTDWSWASWIRAHAHMTTFAVSFNYDLLLESALALGGRPITRFGVDGYAASSLLLKPHGSIDFACDPRAIFMPPSTYPLTAFATLNNTPLVSVPRSSLRSPRQEGFVVLPAEYSPYLNYQWVTPGYAALRTRAAAVTHCVFVGLSDWHCDRPELDTILGSLSPKATVVVANPNPPISFLSRVGCSGRTLKVWRNGPESL